MNFEDKAELVDANTPNYSWKQTLEEVTVSINVPEGTRGKDVVCKIDTNHLKVVVRQKVLIDGELFLPVKPGDSTWSVEDRKLLCLVLQKSKRHDSWASLIKGEHTLDALTKDKMDKQMMLEKMQSENPGFDFSGAEFNGALPENPQTFMDDIKQQ